MVLGSTLLLALSSPVALASDPSDNANKVAVSVDDPAPLPDTPSSTQAAKSDSFADSLGKAAKTIGQDELHILKSPFSKKAIKWDVLVVGATAVLIANDESVLYQASPGWHNSSIWASNSALAATALTAGGIYLDGVITKDDHAQEVGIRSAESTIDAMILYGAMKAIFARQRPFTGEGEGKFFSGNWTNGSFPSGHSAFTWAIASTVAHEYHNHWLQLAMYGLAGTVSVTRVTAREHFPSDVFVGSILGYGIGTYVAHKPSSTAGVHSQSKFKTVPDAILQHVTIGASY